MRILVVNNFFPPRVGGSSHLSDSLAKGYAAAGHEVLVLTAAFKDAPATEERDGFRIVRLPAFMLPESRLAVSFDISFATRPSLGRAIAGLLGQFRPDVIHQHGQFMDLTWATGRYARKHKIPTLLSIHTRLENPAAKYRHAFRGLDATVVKPQLLLYKPRMVVMDVHMEHYIQHRYRGAYSGLVPIPVGVDPAWVRGGDARRGRETLGIAEDPIIASVGHVIPLRDRVGVVEALPGILEKHPNAKLAVVGRVYWDLFLRRAEELGVSHAIVSTGAVPKTDIPHILAAASVEAHEMGDGLGTATLEAMGAGVPVAGWGRLDNFPGIQLEDGANICLAPPGDVYGLSERIIGLLDDPERARQIGASGRRLIDEHFTIDRVIEQHLSVLGAMAGAPAHPHAAPTDSGPTRDDFEQER